MASLTPTQLATRRRVEAALRLAAPGLDLVLAVGDRISRVAGRRAEDPEPPRRHLATRAGSPLGGGPGPA